MSNFKSQISNIKSDLSTQQALKAHLPRAWPAFFERHGSFTLTQLAAIPPLLDGESVMLSAPTASGKTEAVVAPLVERHCLHDQAGGLRILYITPTKALANDLLHRLTPPLDALRLSFSIKTHDLNTFQPKRPSRLLITTPESVDSLLASHARVFIDLKAIILDELHLFDGSPRGDQLRVVLNRLRQVKTYAAASGDAPEAALQYAALSATVVDPIGMAARYFPDAQPIRVEGGRAIRTELLPLAEDGAGELIDYLQTFRARGWNKAVAFCNNRAEVESYAAAVRRRSPFGDAVYVHYSNIETDRREEIERRFAGDEVAICFASSTLELGIDIGNIDVVILLGPPGNSRSFIQRIGRGNRRRRVIQAACFYRSPLEALLFRVLIALAAESYPTAAGGAAFRPAVAIQQISSLIKQNPSGAVRLEGLAPLFEGMLPREQLEEIVGYLQQIDYLQPGRPGEWRAGKWLNRLVDEQAKPTASLSLYSNITVDPASIEVRDRHTQRTVARVAPHLLQHSTLTLEGRALSVEWQDGEVLWVAFDPDLDTGEKLPHRSERQWLSYEVARALPAQIGLAPGAAPWIETPEGWLWFHWLGDLYGYVLLDLLGRQVRVEPTEQPGLSLRMADRPMRWPEWSEEQVVAYLQDSYRKYEPMLALGAFQHLLPESARRQAVIEQVGVASFLEAVGRLRPVGAPEDMREDLAELLAEQPQ